MIAVVIQLRGLARMCQRRSGGNTKGDVTRDDSQRRFLAQHSVATVFQSCQTRSQQCCSAAVVIKIVVANCPV